ncbi:hypothetical protein [Pelagibius sp. Alg239-R121]|uniref:hypothetical protein n=1 Tax=Pelagibius sp. Alg239-R121 TaxID=2993448 RepID=UPI0024A60BB9|nr:hypothetical protein [Pelagibius sp. Alg239-R121]
MLVSDDADASVLMMDERRIRLGHDVGLSRDASARQNSNKWGEERHHGLNT